MFEVCVFLFERQCSCDIFLAMFPLSTCHTDWVSGNNYKKIFKNILTNILIWAHGYSQLSSAHSTRYLYSMSFLILSFKPFIASSIKSYRANSSLEHTYKQCIRHERLLFLFQQKYNRFRNTLRFVHFQQQTYNYHIQYLSRLKLKSSNVLASGNAKEHANSRQH